MKKWHPPRYEDQLDLDDGVYVIADRADRFGPRAFMVVNIFWEDREISYLSDAATDWGLAPWALENARESMRVKLLGPWNSIVESQSHLLTPVMQACRELADEKRFNYCALLLLRSAMRMESIAKGGAVGVELARRCLRYEIERDSEILKAKKIQYMREHPDWTPPLLAPERSDS